MLGSAYPFIASMAPIERIPSNGFEIDISDLSVNNSKLIIMQESKKIESLSSTSWVSGKSLLVVRGDKDYYLYRLPIWEGKVIMPWHFWGQHEGYCPDIQVGTYNGTKVIKCGTPNYSEFLTKQWYWSIVGKNLGNELPNLQSVHFIKSGDKIIAYEPTTQHR